MRPNGMGLFHHMTLTCAACLDGVLCCAVVAVTAPVLGP